jgi:hypothetical protein
MKNNSLAFQKLKMMKASVRCLTFGLLGLLPIIGVPFALAGLWNSFAARKQERLYWNPAKPHRIIGLICAALGALIWSGVDTIIIYHACNRYVQL